ncbi:MAG: alkaline phosphatase D family protein [Pseudomonadota bacterium]
MADDQTSQGRNVDATTRQLPRGLVAGALLSVPVAVVLFGSFLLVREVVRVEPTKAPAVSPTVQSDAGEATDTRMTQADPGSDASANVAPSTPWLPIDPKRVVTRIGIGSCLSQRHPQPIWNGVLGLEKQPDLFLMIGDNVYGDIKSPDGRELIEAYRAQAAHPEFGVARAALPMLATWDDHDYGSNDGGADFAYRELAGDLFKSFWQVETGRSPDEGIYYSRMLGPEGQRVQLIFLDTRSFRGPLTRKTASFPYWGRYAPSVAENQSMLGEQQWAWLAAELLKPAEIRVIVSSVQVLAEGHGFERWGNLPKERKRLMQVISDTAASGVVFVSGDRHAGALYAQASPLVELAGQDDVLVPELTTSSLNRSYGPSKDAPHPVRVSDIFHQENFGLIDVDWEARRVTLSLRDMVGEALSEETFSFRQLGVGQ